MVLLENGKLVDTTIGETVPEGSKPMPVLTKEQLAAFDQYTLEDMSMHVGFVGRYKASSFKGFPNKTPNTLRWIDVIGPKNSAKHNFAVKPGDPNGDGFNVFALHKI